MKPRPRVENGCDGGFTLIEILAVMLILSILVVLLVTQVQGADSAAKTETTRRDLALLSAAIDQYEAEFGEYPPSSFAEESGESSEGTNVGVEALVVALWSRGWEAGGLLADVVPRLENTDGDYSTKGLTDFGTRELLEIVDAWKNPIAYLHRRDYGKSFDYVTDEGGGGEPTVSQVRALEDARTKRFYRPSGYQLLSAGEDGLFGTEDDIAGFERRRP